MDSALKSTEEGSVHGPEHVIRMGKEMAQRVPGDGAGDVQPGPWLHLKDADVTLEPWKWEASSMPHPGIRNKTELGRPGSWQL